jgi:hypothetical protein
MQDANGNEAGGAHTSPAAHARDEGSRTPQSRALAAQPASGMRVAADAAHVPGRGTGAVTCMWVPSHPSSKSTHAPSGIATVAHCEAGLHIPPRNSVIVGGLHRLPVTAPHVHSHDAAGAVGEATPP